MLIPHLHFRGNCKEALSFYENAFNVKADTVIFRKDGGGSITDTAL
jgi:uncharacterized glyoxalase superfamily protein PhnB